MHGGRDQIHRLNRAARVDQNRPVCHALIFPGNTRKARGESNRRSGEGYWRPHEVTACSINWSTLADSAFSRTKRVHRRDSGKSRVEGRRKRGPQCNIPARELRRRKDMDAGAHPPPARESRPTDKEIRRETRWRSVADPASVRICVSLKLPEMRRRAGEFQAEWRPSTSRAWLQRGIRDGRQIATLHRCEDPD